MITSMPFSRAVPAGKFVPQTLPVDMKCNANGAKCLPAFFCQRIRVQLREFTRFEAVHELFSIARCPLHQADESHRSKISKPRPFEVAPDVVSQAAINIFRIKSCPKIGSRPKQGHQKMVEHASSFFERPKNPVEQPGPLAQECFPGIRSHLRDPGLVRLLRPEKGLGIEIIGAEGTVKANHRFPYPHGNRPSDQPKPDFGRDFHWQVGEHIPKMITCQIAYPFNWECSRLLLIKLDIVGIKVAPIVPVLEEAEINAQIVTLSRLRLWPCKRKPPPPQKFDSSPFHRVVRQTFITAQLGRAFLGMRTKPNQRRP